MPFPVDPAAYEPLVRQELPKLDGRWADVVEQRSGGTRPGFDQAFAFWNALPSIPPLTTVPFLFGLYPGLTGGTENIADGNVTSTGSRSTRRTPRPGSPATSCGSTGTCCASTARRGPAAT
ncbi:hypothetical protein GCM10020218_058620 [Dactylosporangium vinaceum]